MTEHNIFQNHIAVAPDRAYTHYHSPLPTPRPPARPEKKILIVDDDPMISKLIGNMLETGGYTSRLSGNGMRAKGILAREDFDLVITDLHMPEVNGLDLLAWIKQSLPVPPKVVIITGDYDKSLAIEATRKGADGYLLKPFNMVSLLSSIKYWLDEDTPAMRPQPDSSRNISSEQVVDLVKNAAHDIRGGLVNVAQVMMLCEKNKARRADAKADMYFSMTREKINQLTGMTEDYFSLALMCGRNEKIIMENVELERDVISAVLSELSLEIKSAKAKIIAAHGMTPQQPPRLHGNRVLLKSVFRILFTNAIRYGDTSKPITYGILFNGSEYLCNVYNSGKVVPADQRERIFEDTSAATRKSSSDGKQGLGVGLSLARKIIASHRGRIWYEPWQDGSNFIFNLPMRN
jgi:DNA-binding response OmpR family regulator